MEEVSLAYGPSEDESPLLGPTLPPTEEATGLDWWRAFVPDSVEPWVEPVAEAWRYTAPEVVENYIDGEEVSLDVLRDGITKVGDAIGLPATAVQELIEEAGDSRDALAGVFKDLMGEAGKSRDGLTSLITTAIKEAGDVGQNLTWAFIIGNLTLGALLLVGGGAALYFAGSKVDLLADLGKLLGGK